MGKQGKQRKKKKYNEGKIKYKEKNKYNESKKKRKESANEHKQKNKGKKKDNGGIRAKQTVKDEKEQGTNGKRNE